MTARQQWTAAVQRATHRTRANKYHAITVVEGGIRFDSLKEAKRYRDLLLMQSAGVVRSLEPHPSFDLWVLSPSGECVTFGRFTADSRYELEVHGEWHPIVEDVKSPATRMETSYRLRKRAAEAIYGITITEV